MCGDSGYTCLDSLLVNLVIGVEPFGQLLIIDQSQAKVQIHRIGVIVDFTKWQGNAIIIKEGYRNRRNGVIHPKAEDFKRAISKCRMRIVDQYNNTGTNWLRAACNLE